ncbi:hypothetical protein Tco_0369346 [Tanacetum coccineum]
MTDQGRVSTWMISCMTQLMEASGQTYQAFDRTFRGSSLVVFERRTRQRTGEASTSAAPYGVSTSIGYGCMTRSSTKELFTPFNDPKQEFRTSRKHFKTLSLDESRSLDFALFSDQEEYSEEEVTKTMAETMEQYMSKTRVDYGLGIARPKIEDKDNLKTKFLSKYCPLARAAKKMEEINNFQQEPEENLYQVWERFNKLLMKFPQHYLTEIQEVVLFYNGLDVLTIQILDSRGAIPSKTVADAKVAIQEMAEYYKKWHNGTSKIRSTETSDGLAAIQAQLNNLGREIKKVNEKVYAA